MIEPAHTQTLTINARKKLVIKKNNLHLIPPAKAALEEHVKRAAYQGGRVFGQALLPSPELPSPASWGVECMSHTGQDYLTQPTAVMS